MMNKTAIRNFAIWARRRLISDIEFQARRVGVMPDGIAEPLPQSTADLQFFDIGTRDYTCVSAADIPRREALKRVLRERALGSSYAEAYEGVMEQVAYTWFNRLIAVRFMEVNDYLPGRTRVLSSRFANKAEPDIVTSPFESDLVFTAAERDEIARMKDENRLDELFRRLFVRECDALGALLPGLFERAGAANSAQDYAALLLALNFTDTDGIVWHLVHDIPEEDWIDQVQIIGWLYQYYNTEPKDKVFANLKKNIKIGAKDIPAATQLFTPDWIVRYMVENSLGRLWLEGHPSEALRANWKYYLDEAEQEPAVEAKLTELRAGTAKLRPQEIRCIDPCCGSGHIAVYLFDVLMQIYESQGWTRREAVRSILENNLYALDIDERAAQLAYFAVMMKARSYDRRFLTRRSEDETPDIPQPHVRAIRASGRQAKNVHTKSRRAKELIARLLMDFADAKTLGSIIRPSLTLSELATIREELSKGDLSDAALLAELTPLLEQAEMLVQKYDAVVTNPPYMGAKGMNSVLSEFVKVNYADYKSDFFSAFIVRAAQMTKTNGFCGFFTPYVWMFIQSYEKLRHLLCEQKTIETLIQFEYSAFEEATVPVCTFAFRNSHFNKKGCYFRLTDFRGGMEVQRNKTLEAIENHDCGYYYETSAENFSKIPGSPIAYWVSDKIITTFVNFKPLSYFAEPRQGMATADNGRFLRLWHEPGTDNIYFGCKNSAESIHSGRKWFPYNKGGNFRKWYGNNEYLVNWKSNGSEIKSFAGSVIRNPNYYFRSGLTWSSLSSGNVSFRYSPAGFLFDSKGPMCFTKANTSEMYFMALTNSVVAMNYLKILAPTLDFNQGPVGKIPYYVSDNNTYRIESLAKECLTLSRADWDSFETSWDFARHPLVRGLDSVRAAFEDWQRECERRFAQLKANEEELNRIFIDIYGLQDELTPEVEERDVTVRRAELGRDIRSLLSYAVGCMFGRYSLDAPGLAYAGGAWDPGKYGAFPPDGDNCIPITDEAYFADDIVERFCEFLRSAFGANKLEENLDFIAAALGSRGATSREVIRNYFLNDFYADHVKLYQKRPIYWLFDSGKQNGFKALVYMHRWSADTAGNVRVEYLHRVQRVYEREIARMKDVAEGEANTREGNAARRRADKLIRQLRETREYDARLGHAANTRPTIDLDDGVKLNYEKVQRGPDGKSLNILAKI